MLLSVQPVELTIPTLTFRVVVPGHQRWWLRSITANAQRAAGGTPGRGYTLSVTDGTTIVAEVGAQDNGTDPGGCFVTWANCPAASVAAGSIGVTVAPLPVVALNPGYQLVGEIVNPAAGDTWADVTAWYDFAYTN